MEFPRIIFNHDGGKVTTRHTPLAGGFPASPREYQEAALRPFVGTHVDTLFWCIGTDVFNIPLHSGERLGEGYPEDVSQITTMEGPQDDILQFRRLWAEGTDPLALVIEGARHHHLRIYASFRMNDAHFVHWKDWFGEECDLRWCRFNREHPEFTIDGGRSPLDFAHPEVQDYRLAQIEEVCGRYDVDGVELDFFRHPRYFKPPAAEKAAIFTDYLARIRRAVDDAGRRRGRPIRIAARVPHNLRESMVIGFDLAAWMQARLVDLLVLGDGNLTHDLPIGDVVDLAHRHDIQVYPSLNFYKPNPLTRAWAANARAKGIDGLYTFNWQYDSRAWEGACPMLKEIGEAPPRRSKLFWIDPVFRGFGPHLAAREAAPLPLPLDREPALLLLRVHEPRADLATARRTLFVSIWPADATATLSVTLNGTALVSAEDYASPDREYLRPFETLRGEPYSAYAHQHGELYAPTHRFDVPAGILVEGINQVFVNADTGKTAVELKSLSLFVDYTV